MSQLKTLVNKNKDDVDMRDQYDNDTIQEISGGEEESEITNFLEEASKSIHHNLEALHALIHQSNAEIPVAAEIVNTNCLQMNDIRISLASKTSELGNLAEHLKFYYKETCHVVEEALRNANDEKKMDGS